MNEIRIFVINATHAAAVNAALEAEGFGPNVFVANVIPATGKRNDKATLAICDGQFRTHQLPIIQGLVAARSGIESNEGEPKGRSAGRGLGAVLGRLNAKVKN